jgi:putative transposase
MRARGGLPTFRERALAAAVERALRCASREAFRVIHFSIQSNHIHLIVEASDKMSLSRGMQGLNVRVARAVNDVLRVRGKVWRERYHARELRTPRSVRNALVYVLMNAKKHGHGISGVDLLSSARWFDGFAGPISITLVASDSPVRAPRTWLAGVGWRRAGLVRADERPRAPE